MIDPTAQLDHEEHQESMREALDKKPKNEFDDARKWLNHLLLRAGVATFEEYVSRDMEMPSSLLVIIELLNAAERGLYRPKGKYAEALSWINKQFTRREQKAPELRTIIGVLSAADVRAHRGPKEIDRRIRECQNKHEALAHEMVRVNDEITYLFEERENS